MEYANQTIGSHTDKSVEYVAIWFDESRVSGFSFHSCMIGDVVGNRHLVHGITVDALHVFSAAKAFNSSPDKAITPDGKSFWVTRVYLNDGTEELRAGDRWGKCVARMIPTGYVQPGVRAA
jgi:hypothetical protein